MNGGSNDNEGSPEKDKLAIDSIAEGVPYLVQLANNTPTAIKIVPEKGRGLFATRSFKAGEVVYREMPFVAQSVLLRKPICCSQCLKPFPRVKSKESSIRENDVLLCSNTCKNTAFDQYGHLSVGENNSMDDFVEYCYSVERKFPILVARIMGRIIEDVRKNASVSKTVTPLSHLSYADIPTSKIPHEWVEDYAAFKKSFLVGSKNAEFFTVEWFVRMLSMLNLNSFRVEIETDSDIENEDSEDDVGRLTNETVNTGTALYFLSSFINHDCSPNLRGHWPCSSEMFLISNRDIREGEELTVSYIANQQNMRVGERRDFLHWAYGFECQCPLCVKESKV
eukprot:Nk52_evm5s859 gene=Nk52_evmTU5s859